MTQVIRIAPQKGFQERFLSNPADIVIAGSGAGVGKSWSLLADAVRYKDTKDYGAVIFRRTTPQIKNIGGLWDASMDIYPHLGGSPRESALTWKFNNGVKIKFAHLEYEKNKLDWQGAEVPYIGFDELTHFTRSMFFYLLSRNRSTCGVKPCVRATCNPDPDSWVADFISWWIDDDTGFPIEEKVGKLRYLFVDGDNDIWGDSPKEVIELAWDVLGPMVEKSGIDPTEMIKSVSFVPGSIYDNKKLLSKNPAYLSNLLAQDEQTRSQLLDGNWKVKVSQDEIISYQALRDSFTNTFVEEGEKFIIADIATHGSDKYIPAYFNGWRLEDIEVIDKSSGKKIVDVITKMQEDYKVPNRNVIYDADGVGSFIGGDDGFIPNSRAFNGGSSPVPEIHNGKEIKQNYQHLKAQCAYKLGEVVNQNKLFISELVANKMYDDKSTVRQRMMFERRAIKKYKSDFDGKLRLLPKEKMKSMLNGSSPDLMDVLIMRKFPELSKPVDFSYVMVTA